MRLRGGGTEDDCGAVPQVAQWSAHRGWDEGRVKEPPPSALKFRQLAAYIQAMLRHWSATYVLLHEPGFHWILPALQRLPPRSPHEPAAEGATADDPVCYCLVADPLQLQELRRRGLGAGEPSVSILESVHID
jgi:hypothetical protein